MIIESSNVNMASKRSYSKREISYQKYESSFTGMGNDKTLFEDLLTGKAADAEDTIGKATAKDPASEESASKESSLKEASPEESSLEAIRDRLNSTGSIIRNNLHSNRLKQIEKIRHEVIQHLIDMLFGKKSVKNQEDSLEELTNDSQMQSKPQLQTAAPVNFGVMTNVYTNYYQYTEEETVNFSTTGTVKTADGRSIDFGIDVTLSRSFAEEVTNITSTHEPVLIDPLVINVDSSFTGISDQTFFFDLDADGELDEIHGLEKGSGFLALDKDENGKIDDGSELFGTSTGNGFSELRAYDKDNNGWIDEADEIYKRLKVWYHDEDGTERLVDLKEAGVGAIYLGNAEGDYSLTNEKNETNAVIRRHGIFLYENGNVGTINQVDMAKPTEYSA